MGRKVEDTPKWIIVYDCPACGTDSGMTELQRPTCFACGSKNVIERERKPFTPEALAERMKVSADRMLLNLQKAYEEGPGNPKEEALLLSALAKAKDYKDKIHSMAEEMAKQSKKD